MIAARELAGFLGTAGLSLDAEGNPEPFCVLIDLDGPIPDFAPIGVAAGATTAVLVGVARRPPSAAARMLSRALTCTVIPSGAIPSGTNADQSLVSVPDPDAAAAELLHAVGYAPRAAMSLARLLRLTADIPVSEGLGAESAVYSMLLAGREFARWLAERRPPRPMAETGPAVRVTRRGDALDLVIDRPSRHNAFDRFVRDGLVEALEVAVADPSLKRVDLRGAGASFCSGGDLAEFGTSDDPSAAHLIRLDRSVAARVFRCHDRVVAHLHGACIGAGVEIPSFAGRVVAREDTCIRLPELRMGLVPGAGGTVGLPRRIGRWRTAYLALTGAQLDLPTALSWGLVDAVADD